MDKLDHSPDPRIPGQATSTPSLPGCCSRGCRPRHQLTGLRLHGREGDGVQPYSILPSPRLGGPQKETRPKFRGSGA